MYISMPVLLILIYFFGSEESKTKMMSILSSMYKLIHLICHICLKSSWWCFKRIFFLSIAILFTVIMWPLMVFEHTEFGKWLQSDKKLTPKDVYNLYRLAFCIKNK